MSESSRAVFLSYASEDAEVAGRIAEALKRAGVEVWFDQSDLRGGDVWDQKIRRQIRDCALFIPVISAHTASRHEGYFRLEWRLADQRTHLMGRQRAFLFPVCVDETPEKDADVPDSFAAVHWTRLLNRELDTAFAEQIRSVLGYPPAEEQASPWRPPMPRSDSAKVATTGAVAVLPFVDMSERKDQEYFADGMAEEIIDLLARIPSLTVIGRTSSFQFKGKNEDLRTIGRALNVAYVVEGSVRRFGDRVRVTAQLINAQTGAPQFSERYERQIGDVLRMQEEIAASLVRALQVTIGADDLRPRPMLRSAEAYDFYLRGRHAFDQFDKAGFEAAAGCFQQALDLDPTFVRAAEWLAATYEFVAEYGLVPVREGFARARASVQQALALDPNSAMSHAVLVSIHATHDWDWAAAAAESERAMALDPRSSMVLTCASDYKKALGELDESARLISASFGRDPLFAAFHGILGTIRYRQDRLSEAEAELRRALTISPSYSRGRRRLGQILLAQGRLDEAITEMQLETADGGRDLGLSIVYHAMKRNTESKSALDYLIAERASDRAYQIAEAFAFSGQPDEAFRWLHRAYDQRDVELYWIKHDPLLRNLEHDNRHKVFLRRMNLPE